MHSVVNQNVAVFFPFSSNISPGTITRWKRAPCAVNHGSLFKQAAVIENVSVRVVRESRGAPHGSHQRIGTRSVGEDPTVLTQRQGVCRSQIPKRSQRRGTTKEDIRVARVRYPPRVPSRVHLVPVNRADRSILPL